MIGNKVYHFKELPSTNEFAKSLIKEAGEWTIVIADKQTEGKGRLGRTWYSPERGLWFSVVLKPNSTIMYQLIPLVAGVAVCEAISGLGVDARIKWPNDILIQEKKVAGILAEFEEGTVVLGIGINLNIYEFPEEIRKIATSLLLEKGRVFNKEEVLNLVLEKVEEKYKLQNFEPLLEEWRDYSITLGNRVRVETTNAIIEGEALDIDNDGALLLKLPSGRIEKIFAGECSVKYYDAK